MLAESLPTGEDSNLLTLDWSVGFLCSPKLDGIRGIATQHELLSRTLNPLPNRSIQRRLPLGGDTPSPILFLDGEVCLGDLTEPIDYNSTQSYVMTRDTDDQHFTYYIFDDITDPGLPFSVRNDNAQRKVEALDHNHVLYLHQEHIKTIEQLLEYEARWLNRGLEGVIMRDPRRPYKNGRSTWKQQGMIKLKRFTDAEAKIVGYEELLRNLNAAELDARGYTKRSDHKANQVPGGTLGYLKCVGLNGIWTGVEFDIGSGFDADTRQYIWDNREKFLGATVKYKYQTVGSKNKPRSPIFLGFRPEGA